ncbi:MAG: pyridoxal phosphate-dependent aminotransferase [Flammeovirgaceae bacterium]|nr:pyridoxal phosphate-dependent aminotransferase [Flammeovirgaceae bacterium]
MNYQLSERVTSMQESQTLAMARLARELQAKGVNVIKLNLGEPDFPTPKHIQEAAIEAIRSEKFFQYPPVPGYPELRKGIADKLKRDNNLDYKPEQIVVSTGAKQSIANVLLSIIDKGDEVIIFAPYWVSYLEQVRLCEGIPVILKGSLENDFKVTAKQLKEAITPKTKAIMFSSPCNPTGSVFSREELRAIAEVLAPHEKIYILADEIYEYINFVGEHASIAEFPFIKDRVIIINGFSKGFAMTGWRLGYIAAPVPIAEACNKIQGQFTSGACSITQRAAIAAITGSLEPAKEMANAYKRRRDLLKKLLDEIPGLKTNLPQGAFYFFPDVSAFFGKSYNGTTIHNSYDLAIYLLNEAHVSIVDGEGFGAPECIRISFAASDAELVEAAKRMKEAFAKLR